ncbi:MAG: hypothetical protein QGI24_00175 [Kiritimatiellia bacterium]|nr:hypothetical protein [Kiritimatiellia bacterium]MDP6847174.1 hypothetical protein [Kiritimatiellia bacterium]
MPFVRVSGIEGLVYVPDEESGPKKHNCPDCLSCGWCSDNRCDACLAKKNCGGSKSVQCKRKRKG